MLRTHPHARIPRAVIALFVVLLTAGLALSLVACATDPSDESIDDIVLVLAPTIGNSGLSGPELDTAIATLDRQGDRLVAVVADGDPFVAVDVTLGELPENSKERGDFLAAFRVDASTAILAKTAASPEVDLTEAIALAAESFRPGARRTLTVFASGLQTVGDLSLLEGRLYAEPADLVTHVEQESGIPTLEDVVVRMPRLGVVIEPQPALTEAARTALTGVWAEYFSRTHAADVQLTPTSLLPMPQKAAGLPFVTPVPIDPPQPPDAEGCRQLLTASSIGFAAGSAELLDPGAARLVMERTHAEIGGCAGSYTVEGSASSEGDEVANKALSRARAETAATLLAEVSGIDVVDMSIVGWGIAWTCRVPDLDANGGLQVAAATANRVVVISKGDTRC